MHNTLKMYILTFSLFNPPSSFLFIYITFDSNPSFELSIKLIGHPINSNCVNLEKKCQLQPKLFFIFSNNSNKIM